MYTITLQSSDNHYFQYISDEKNVHKAIDEALNRIKEKHWDRYQYTVYNVHKN